MFRGDQVKDQTGDLAVFSEQAASASHMSAAKLLSIIARMPGCSAFDFDAVSAYTQVELKGCPTWISLPKDQWPSEWMKLPWEPMVD